VFANNKLSDETMNTILLAAAGFALDWAHSQRAMWVSAAGGTANVLAGEISRFTGSSYEEAHNALDVAGGPDWYDELPAHSNPFVQNDWTDARGLGKAMARRFDLSAANAAIPLPYEDRDVLTPRKWEA
jgi:hypothetical protein